MAILFFLKEYFKCGNINIDNRSTEGYKYIVSNLEDIIKHIIPHFNNFQLVGSKSLDYEVFKQVVYILKNNRSESDCKDSDYKNKVIYLKNTMNKNRSFSDRWNYLNNKSIVINNEWLQAFIDGEGSFQFNVSNTVNRGKPYIVLSSTLEIAQNTHDIKVLDAIRLHLKHGYLKPKLDITCLKEVTLCRSVSRLVINESSPIIEFFEKYPLLTVKKLDFEDWKALINLKQEKVHKTDQGLKLMHTGRILNSKLINTTSKLNFTHWALN